jgi:hypothetical protein
MKSCLFAIKRTRFLMKLMLLTVILVSIPAIQADIITFQYEGEITSVDTGLEGVFSIGDSFEGTYTFESDTDSFSGRAPVFFFENAISATSFTSDTFTASGNSGAFDFDEDHGFYTAYLGFGSVAPVGDFTPLSLSLGWVLSKVGVPNVETGFSKAGMILEQPSFDPNRTPIYVTESMATFLDADGNIVYDGSGKGLIEDPHQPLFFTSRGGGGAPAAGPGWWNANFLDAQGQSSRVKGKLNSVTVVSRIPSLIVYENTWAQIGLNAAPPIGSTVSDIIGDDISAPYGIDWVIYSYQTSTNTYKKLSLTDTMLPGIGYWIIQVTFHPIVIDMPNASTSVNVIGHPACTSIRKGCFEIPLQTSHSIDSQWQMIGYPFRDSRKIDKVRVVTTGIQSDCFIGCTLQEANEKGLVSEAMWHFKGRSYQQLTFGGSELLNSWDGAWIATLPVASGQAPKLLIPAAD